MHMEWQYLLEDLKAMNGKYLITIQEYLKKILMSSSVIFQKMFYQKCKV